MQWKSDVSISYKRETPALAVSDAAEGKHIPDMGAEAKSIEAGGVEGTKDAIEGLADQGVKESLAEQDVEGEKGKGYFPAEHVRDANSRTIFSNRELTCQFLRDYTGISLFSDLRPEDIEDVTDRYKAFLGVEFEADTGLTDELAKYIPNFTYKMVRVHEYENEDLKKKHNEMSLVMMINRIQSPEDYTEFLESSGEYADEIYNGTSEDIRKVYQEVLWTLFQKMNVPVKEARERLAEMEENGVGTLFADMEKMDIQEERRKTKQAREEADAAKKALEEFKLQTDKKLEQSNQKLAESSARMNAFFSKLVSLCQDEKLSREETITCLQERYGLGAEDAVSAVEQFWNH